MTTQPLFIQSALRTIDLEQQAINDLKSSLDENFDKACHFMLQAKGRIVVTGMGKSGHIGNKIAATLASTGSPAFFVHPGEASHGDLGMITKDDVVLALSNSGNTAEIVTIVPLIKRMGAPLITITGNPQSPLSQASDANLNVSIDKEACPLNLAPTSSTTAALVMGDALAIALLEEKGFTADDFAFSHPGGTLGRRLLLKVSDAMVYGDEIPRVSTNTTLSKALVEISEKRLGMTTVVDEQQKVVGVFTDGDLRRSLDSEIDIHRATIGELMNPGCQTVSPDMLAASALKIMEDNQITSVVVVDQDDNLAGVVHLHALLRAGLV
ncbi:Arabinose 5-phosphate isomerase KdsD [Sinobacterium norvegicum]|uniref:Arabinose 5-phosphate isomerase n=1 Tax=Sinobacterium norvegicum TaxID=1641715 RepID=A0ABM9AJD0_9GAMM|nr:KpsF/GutQ family sugar-phosphate isomerase [Sinobacterium norvegicum]CAH0993336.1 Arabinose 5-phosphate isomerase KdsD [Sinobacterium norvegicum]